MASLSFLQTANFVGLCCKQQISVAVLEESQNRKFPGTTNPEILEHKEY
jgi:hypothetical protein